MLLLGGQLLRQIGALRDELSNGRVPLCFRRDAASAEAAIASAVRQVESVAPLTVHHVEPGEYVSLGLIAQRIGRTRESVRQLAVDFADRAASQCPSAGSAIAPASGTGRR